MRQLVTFLVLSPVLLSGCASESRPAEHLPDEPTATRRVVRPDHFPASRSYSFAVLAGETLYLSGQAGVDLASGEQPEGIAAQTRQAMENIGQVLRAADMDYWHLVKCHVYLDSMDDYTGMNQAYGSFFSERVPARTTVEAEGLPRNAGVVIGCIAHRDVARVAVVQTPPGALPTPLGPYSPAVWAGDTLYLSGMGGQFPEDRRLPEPLGDQVTQTLVNIQTTLQAAGLRPANVVTSNVYVTVPEELGALDEAYASWFASMPEPPRGVILLPRLPGGIKTEITFVAVRPTDERQVVSAPDDGVIQAIRVGGTLYTRIESAPDAGPAFEEQFRGVLHRLERSLGEAGLDWRDVAHVQVYLTDLDDMALMNQMFRETFPEEPPARTVIQVRPADGARVQVALVAAR